MVAVSYSIVIPVYNSGAWMDELVDRIGAVMERYEPERFELILVNDCSPDALTWPAIMRNAQKNAWVRGFDLLYNVGQFRALMCGLQQARGAFVITMDDDLQHLPEEIPKLIDAMRGDADVLCVMGRYETKRHNGFRNAGSRFHQRVMSLLYGKPAHIQTSSFRIMRKDLCDALLACRTAKPQISPLVFSMTRKVKNVAVKHATRMHGRSGYRLKTLVGATLENIINTSTVPLKIFSLTGFACAAASLSLAVFFLLRKLTGGIKVAGFTSLILLITFLGGMILAGIGVLGEYMARIISELTGPERFRIKAATGENDH